MPWRQSLPEAAREAAAGGRLVFLELTSPGCPACARLEAQSYPDPAVRSLLAQYVPVKVDLTINTQLADRYSATSSPDLLLLTPDGRVINRISRFVPAADLSDFLRAGLAAPERGLAPERSVPWAVSYAEAQRTAKESGRPVFVYIWNYG